MLKEIKAVAWSFLGLRKKKDLEQDFQSINPLKLVLAGFIMVLVFIFSLIAIIKFVVL